MATNSGNQGGSRGRGFASMDDDQQRQIARKGGQASARSQKRDAQGQFAGSRGSGGSAAGGSAAAGGGRGGNQGGGNRGSRGSQGGGSNR